MAARVALLEARICELQTTVARLISILGHGGIGAAMIGPCAVRNRHVCDGEITIQKLSRLPLGSITFPVLPPVEPRVPQVNYRVENLFYGSREPGDPMLDDHIGWQVDLVANRQVGIVTHELDRTTLRRYSFSSIFGGSFTSPSGHTAATGLTGHPPPPEHGISTLLTPLVSIEDGMVHDRIHQGGWAQKRVSAYSLEALTEAMNGMLDNIGGAQPHQTIGPPAGLA